ncbi:WYL domain-containing protein [Alteromonas sp. KS69]|jgi:hypothetical protein|uniref:WYL domain-containing protein n=1 Tax=Alteromonas sp. KS69 TaxID=2109917 RepID=UPI000F874486|nr:WYL domain-containing protein [Alteromonas sp. KS69]RUP82362.1 WYL domain-containing protein [Alteromonas sp. KS69]|tara:strand:+ start:13932 stop:14771 length:840 start_codon:yes stop_codon:yes gene_type:complete
MNGQHLESRYWFIELHAFWQGLVNSRHITEYFQISRTQAQKYITAYQQIHPLNLVYDKSSKGFCITHHFAPHYITGNANEYLEWLHTQTNEVFTSTHSQLTNASLNLPKRCVHPDVIRGLSKAIKLRRRLEVDYVSLKNPDGEGRIIQPHVFVKTGLRWHLRAFDEKHQQFRDFVLSRFNGAPEILEGETVSPSNDEAWQTFIDLRFVADLRLSPAQKYVIEQDYQMLNGELTISTRAALAQYVLQEMQVNTKFIDEYPEAQQLVLANKEYIQKWLFNG